MLGIGYEQRIIWQIIVNHSSMYTSLMINVQEIATQK